MYYEQMIYCTRAFCCLSIGSCWRNTNISQAMCWWLFTLFQTRKIMQIFWALFASILILYVWIWLINTTFWQKSIKTTLFRKIITIGIILVGTLFAYGYLFSITPYQNWNFITTMNWRTTWLFAGYCTGILFLILLIFRKWKKIILQTLLIGAVFFFAAALGGIFWGINTLILYYIIAAYAEEYMKYTSSTLFFGETFHGISDMIFFCILLGLGFSVAENIFYLASVFFHQETINLVGFAVGRWLISALLHVAATTTIGSIYYALQKKIKRPLAIGISILSGVLLHSSYNISLSYNFKYITIPLIIFMIFLLSFFLFQSDLLYKGKW